VKRAAVSLVAGTLFGAGLAWSGMVDPLRVRDFLDLFGSWDPTLAFVMAGAIIPMAAAWVVRSRLERPLADVSFSLPETNRLDWQLAAGAILFGAGWGLGGLCPGPAVADIGLAPLQVAPFLIAMVAGMALHRVTSVGNARPWKSARSTQA
jgi:uncharacterized membrane protein YedE/YeeE